jgi:hypothetical protein
VLLASPRTSLPDALRGRMTEIGVVALKSAQHDMTLSAWPPAASTRMALGRSLVKLGQYPSTTKE